MNYGLEKKKDIYINICENSEKDDQIDTLFRNDKLNRKQIIKDLTLVLENTKDPFTLAINASWGTGKTTFVKLWSKYLEINDIKSIYFSAWENDFSNDPLSVILAEINIYIKNNESIKKTIKGKFKKIAEIASKVIVNSTPSIIKILTAGLIEKEDMKEMISLLSENTTKLILDEYEEEKNKILEFKQEFCNFIKEISPNKPFIIFIDELDRCRPLYAIDLLERIKHIFGIENVIFVLSIDKKELSNSIKSQYGDIDTNEYLRRFIDLEFKLENKDLEGYCYALRQVFNVDKILTSKSADNIHMADYIINVIKCFDLTPRQIDTFFIKFSVVAKTTSNDYFLVIAFLILLDIKNHKLYEDFINGKAKEEVKQLVANLDLTGGYYNYIFATIEVIGLSIKQYEAKIKDFKQYSSPIVQTDKLYKSIYNIIVSIPDGGFSYYMFTHLKEIIEKINFSNGFYIETKEV